MHELTDRELFNAVAYAKNLDEDKGRKILERFQVDQPALAGTIFSIFPMVIGEQNQEMAELFMDLCFDVICVFENVFGTIPSQSEIDGNWLEKQAVLLQAELQSLMGDLTMDDKMRNKLQDRFLQRNSNDNPQPGLVAFMNATIDEFASENPSRVKATRTVQTLIFVVIRLFGSLYNHASKK